MRIDAVYMLLVRVLTFFFGRLVRVPMRAAPFEQPDPLTQIYQFLSIGKIP